MLTHPNAILGYLSILLLATVLGATPIRAENAPIQASMDEAKRNVRLEPIGATIRIPDDLTVKSFYTRPDNVSIIAQRPDQAGVFAQFYFQAGACKEWFAASGPPFEKKTKQRGAELVDDRWNPDWLLQQEMLYFCLDQPTGGSVRLETSAPFDESPQHREPFCQFTANMADALQPGTSRAVAACLNAATAAVSAEAAKPKSSIKVDDVYPQRVRSVFTTCHLENRLCDHAAKYREIHKQCVDGNAGACSAMGVFAGDDYKSAATFYQRACDLGAGDDACKKAKKNAKKAR